MADENLGGGNPAAAGAGAGNTPQDGNNAPGGDKPVAGAGGGGTPAEKTFSFKEDRSDWVPRSRLNEVTSRLTKYEQENLTLKEQNALAEKRTRALAGLEPEDPKAKDTEEIKAALTAMFPQLKAIDGLTPEQLQEVLEAAQTARSSSEKTWARHASGMLNDLESQVAEKIGSDKLTPTQSKSLKRAYREEAAQSVQDRKAAMERGERNTLETLATDNDFLARHEAGDKALLKEFAQAYLADWFEPARRSVAAQQARRFNRVVPRGERTRQIPAQGAPQVDYNNEADFKKALIAARSGGGRE
jgi:hypothetical protein